jgi:hypothetical protein
MGRNLFDLAQRAYWFLIHHAVLCTELGTAANGRISALDNGAGEALG